MSKKNLFFDERNRAIMGKICIILYAFTIYFLLGDILYREFVLHQTPEQFEDIAALTTANILLFITLMFAMSGVSVPKFSLKKIVIGYIVFVILGILFTAFRYGIWTPEFILAKSVIVVSISAALFGIGLSAAMWGKDRIERDIK
jgi:hypothetical protein